jgi:hypothetical protein
MHLLENQNIGNKMEKNNWQNSGMDNMVMGKCEGGQIESFYNETNCEHFQGWYGGLQFGTVYTCNVLLQRLCKFKEADSKAFFHKLIEQFVNRRLANTWKFAIHKIY